MTKHMKKGFTLVELIFSVSILTIFSIAAAAFWMGATHLWQDNSAKIETDVSSEKALQLVSRELRQARYSTLLVSGQANNRVVEFEVPFQTCDNNENNCQWLFGVDQIQGGKIRYFVDQNQLIRETRDVGNNILTQRLIAVNITEFDIQLAVTDAYLGNLVLYSAVDKPKTYEIKVTSASTSLSNRLLSTTITSRVTVKMA